MKKKYKHRHIIKNFIKTLENRGIFDYLVFIIVLFLLVGGIYHFLG